jgi:hypothetical protein
VGVNVQSKSFISWGHRAAGHVRRADHAIKPRCREVISLHFTSQTGGQSPRPVANPAKIITTPILHGRLNPSSSPTRPTGIVFSRSQNDSEFHT